MRTKSTQHTNGKANGAKVVASKYGKPAQGPTREEKGLELYEQGAVERVGNDAYKVCGRYTVHVGDVSCDCEDRRFNLKDGQPCKHLYAAKYFIQAQGKHNGQGANKASSKPVKPLTKDERITRLATLNMATTILQSRGQAITLDDVIELATELEQWAKGGQVKPSTQSAVEKYAYMYD